MPRLQSRRDVLKHVEGGHMGEENRLLESCTALGHEVKDADCSKGNTKEILGEKCVSHWNTQTLEEAAQSGHPALGIFKTE